MGARGGKVGWEMYEEKWVSATLQQAADQSCFRLIPVEACGEEPTHWSTSPEGQSSGGWEDKQVKRQGWIRLNCAPNRELCRTRLGELERNSKGRNFPASLVTNAGGHGLRMSLIQHCLSHLHSAGSPWDGAAS